MGTHREQIESLTKRDRLAFGITYIDLLEGKKWEVANRKWSEELYNAGNPWYIEKYPTEFPRRVVVTKSTQAGISTWGMTAMFHFAVNWPVRIFYTLPRQQDLFDLVSTRVDPMIAGSPYLKDKIGTPNSTHAKQIGRSYLFFMELTTEPRMMPADMVIVDEVDLSDYDNMATVLNRMDASKWKISLYLSTPTVPNYGIHGMYEHSDKRQWLIKCPKCNHEQPLDWEVNLRFSGPDSNPDKVWYGCEKCSTEITNQHMQTGRWVAESPYMSDEIIGYHVHQMLTTPAPALYKIWRDPQTKIVEFYRKRLGKPYEIGGGSVERSDFLVNCFDEPYQPEHGYDGRSRYYIGVDQGNELQVIIGKQPPGHNRIKVVHIEAIQLEEGFDKVAKLIRLFKIRKGVIDGNPNRHNALDLTKAFPGIIMVADYSDQRTTWKTRKNQKGILDGVVIDRTSGFDGLMESIKNGEWQFPGNPPGLSPEVETVIDHVTSLKRDLETRKTKSGEVQVAVYRKLRADHFAHSMLYMKTAAEIDRGRNSRIAVIGSQQNEEDEEEELNISTENLVGITALLAEVPIEQIIEYLDNGDEDDYQLPFPLSYKLGKAQKLYDMDDIIIVMGTLAYPKNSTSKVLTIQL